MTVKQAVVKRLLRDIVLMRGSPVDHVISYLLIFFLSLFYLFLPSVVSCLFFLFLFVLLLALQKP